jgi:type II restriction enzyme
LFDCNHEHYDNGGIVSQATAAIMLGELKGGIDPAGADEHWKTANTALDRIRNSFGDDNPSLQTSFIGAAIENSMAEEIFSQLQTQKLSFAANLTKSEQVYEYCKWLLSL